MKRKSFYFIPQKFFCGNLIYFKDYSIRPSPSLYALLSQLNLQFNFLSSWLKKPSIGCLFPRAEVSKFSLQAKFCLPVFVNAEFLEHSLPLFTYCLGCFRTTMVKLNLHNIWYIKPIHNIYHLGLHKDVPNHYPTEYFRILLSRLESFHALISNSYFKILFINCYSLSQRFSPLYSISQHFLQ